MRLLGNWTDQPSLNNGNFQVFQNQFLHFLLRLIGSSSNMWQNEDVWVPDQSLVDVGFSIIYVKSDRVNLYVISRHL